MCVYREIKLNLLLSLLLRDGERGRHIYIEFVESGSVGPSPMGLNECDSLITNITIQII